MASSLYHKINKLSNQHIPLHEIRFTHGALADTWPYMAVFGKVPRFGGKDNVLRMSKEVLKYPILYSDARLLGVFENMARETKDELTQASTFSDRVVQWMKECVPSFFPTLQQTAEYFKISTRTLQHKLKAEQTSWNFYGSSTHNPFLILLEFIWTKLNYKYNLSDEIFGEDLDIEGFHPFLLTKAKKNDDKIGWETRYIYIPKEGLDHEPLFGEWKPAELDEVECFIINWLCLYRSLIQRNLGFKNG